MIIYFPLRLHDSEDGRERQREEFYEKLKEIQWKSIKQVFEWQSFYAVTTYIMLDGSKCKYIEDTEYGVPYSLEVTV